MLKKVIAYQKLFLNSVPSINLNGNTTSKTIFTIAFYAFVFFMMANLFDGAYYPVILPIVSVWMINRNFNGDQPLFDMVPVSRKFIVFNTYLAAVFIVIVAFLTMWVMGLAFFGIIFGAIYIFSPESIVSGSLNSTTGDTLTTFQGDMFMLLVMIIILFIGTTIIFIRNKNYRYSALVGMVAVVYGVLFFLKSNMPATAVTDQMSFLESLSVMPQISELLMGIGIATLIIAPLSVYIGYRLYMAPHYN